VGGRDTVCDEREPEQDVTTVSAAKVIARRTTRSNLVVLIENVSVARHVVSSNFRAAPVAQSAVVL